MSEFARLKPRDLLKATEKSINNGELWDLHERLIERKTALNDQTHVRTQDQPSLPPTPKTLMTFSVSNESVLDVQERLLPISNNILWRIQSVRTMEMELASLQQLNAGLQRDLQRYQEREDLLGQVREPGRDDGRHVTLTGQHDPLKHANVVLHSWKLFQCCSW